MERRWVNFFGFAFSAAAVGVVVGLPAYLDRDREKEEQVIRSFVTSNTPNCTEHFRGSVDCDKLLRRLLQTEYGNMRSSAFRIVLNGSAPTVRFSSNLDDAGIICYDRGTNTAVFNTSNASSDTMTNAFYVLSNIIEQGVLGLEVSENGHRVVTPCPLPL